MKTVRAACHVHSDWSYDGKRSLAEVAQVFGKRGYDVVLVTEHDRGFDEARRLEHRAACMRASSPEILLVPGIEYSDPSNTIHLLVWGDVPFIGSGVEPERVLSATQEWGGVTVFAHPSRKRAWERFKPAWTGQLLGIEFWNRKADGWAPSKEAWPLLELTRVVPFASLDFHDMQQIFPLAMLLGVQSTVSETAVLAALTARRCRASAFGLPPGRLQHGLRAESLHRVEKLRRRAAALYRSVASS